MGTGQGIGFMDHPVLRAYQLGCLLRDDRTEIGAKGCHVPALRLARVVGPHFLPGCVRVNGRSHMERRPAEPFPFWASLSVGV